MTNDSSREAVAANIRAEMGRRRVSALALAAGIGKNRVTIGSRLRCRSDFTVTEIQQISEFLEVPVSTLLGLAAA